MAKVNLISYPAGSGGKCVANCLGLSSHATIMHHILGYGTAQQKFDYFIEKFNLAKRTNKWTDLELGSITFVGHTLDFNDTFTPEELVSVYDELTVHPEFTKLLKGPKDIFIIAHSASASLAYKKIYNCNKVIRFINTVDMVYRRPNYSNGSSCMEKETYKLLCESSDKKIGDFISWDCKWFNNKIIFLDQIEKLYEKLEYTDFDSAKPFISDYYSLWIDTIYNVK